MRLVRLTVRILGLFLTCTTLTAHPGDNSYWLIEVGDHIIRSSILLPDHLLIDFFSSELDQNKDGIMDQQELLRSGDEITATLRNHVVLEAEPALERTRADEFFLESGGFLEVVSTYSRPPETQRLKMVSLLNRLGSGSHTTLCRVIGGMPVRFTLEETRHSAEVELAAVKAAAGQQVSQLSDWRDALRPAVYTLLFLLVLGLVILGLRTRLG